MIMKERMKGVLYAKDYRKEMNPRVVNVKPEKDYTLHVWFENGEEGILDMKPYLDTGGPVFYELKDKNLFDTVKPFLGTIQWANEADLCPDTVYLESVKPN
jgi:hypothetical protein